MNSNEIKIQKKWLKRLIELCDRSNNIVKKMNKREKLVLVRAGMFYILGYCESAAAILKNDERTKHSKDNN